MAAFRKYYSAIENGEYAAISEIYHSGLYRSHGFHRYRDKDGELVAAVVEVEDDGTLILRDKEGVMRSYKFKEVSFCLTTVTLLRSDAYTYYIYSVWRNEVSDWIIITVIMYIDSAANGHA